GHPSEGAFNGHQGDPPGHHQIDGQGRRALSQGHHYGEQYAEPYGIPTVGVGDRHEQRHENQEDRDAVQEHADDGQQHDDQRHDPILANAQPDDAVGDWVDNTKRGERPGEDAGERHDEHNHSGELSRFPQDDEEVAELDRPVHHRAYEQTVEHGHDRRLGGCEVAHAHAAQDDDGCGETPDRLVQAAPKGGAWQVAFRLAHIVDAS